MGKSNKTMKSKIEFGYHVFMCATAILAIESVVSAFAIAIIFSNNPAGFMIGGFILSSMIIIDVLLLVSLNRKLKTYEKSDRKQKRFK